MALYARQSSHKHSRVRQVRIVGSTKRVSDRHVAAEQRRDREAVSLGARPDYVDLLRPQRVR
jgi:hypothetical protein